jgi:hypothetical protein
MNCHSERSATEIVILTLSLPKGKNPRILYEAKYSTHR